MLLKSSLEYVVSAPEERPPSLENEKVVCVLLGPFQLVSRHNNALSSRLQILKHLSQENSLALREESEWLIEKDYITLIRQ